MEWKKCYPPDIVNECDCGTESVEMMSDGLVTSYRCSECKTILGDTTMGHEP